MRGEDAPPNTEDNRELRCSDSSPGTTGKIFWAFTSARTWSTDSPPPPTAPSPAYLPAACSENHAADPATGCRYSPPAA